MTKIEYLTEPELRNLTNMICTNILNTFKQQEIENPLFCVLFFNDPKMAHYGSNCQRSDMIKALREAADRLEKNQDVTR